MIHKNRPRYISDFKKEYNGGFARHSFKIDLEELPDAQREHTPIVWREDFSLIVLAKNKNSSDSWNLEVKAPGVRKIRTETGVTTGSTSGGSDFEQGSIISPHREEVKERLDVDNTFEISISYSLEKTGFLEDLRNTGILRALKKKKELLRAKLVEKAVEKELQDRLK